MQLNQTTQLIGRNIFKNSNKNLFEKSVVFLFSLFAFQSTFSQTVPILNYNVNGIGQVQLEIEASADKYYLLTARHKPDNTYESITSITKGVDGLLTITEPLAAFAPQNYKITEHDTLIPEDTDGDGINDMDELNSLPVRAPLNFAKRINFVDGSPIIDTRQTYSDLSAVEDNIPWAPFLNNQEFVKFAILYHNTDTPQVFFINSNTHLIHANFYAAINIVGAPLVSGEIVYNPNEILPNGVIGSYSFNFSFGNAYPFELTRRTFELLAANMPFLQNNFQHFIGDGGEDDHVTQYKSSFEGSRIHVVLESEVFSDIDYIPFNRTEGYGLFQSDDAR